MRVEPITCYRPRPELASEFVAPPYDVFDHEGARSYVKEHPRSFLAVDRPETAFPPEHDPCADDVYEKAHELLASRAADGTLLRDGTPCFYLWRQRWATGERTGIVGAFAVDDYTNGVIRRHERTRAAKEEDRARHITATSCQTGPTLLAHRDNPVLGALVEAAKTAEPLYDFVDGEGVRQTVWRVARPAAVESLRLMLGYVDRAYIADGHHRVAAAERVCREMRTSERDDCSGAEAYNFFLGALFPASQLSVMPYNRVVRDVAGLTEDELVSAVEAQGFRVGPRLDAPVEPEGAGVFGMYAFGAWRRLELSGSAPDDPRASLDASVLQDRVLAPVLGIEKPGEDPRIEFVGGTLGAGELERRAGEGGVAFSLFPTTASQLMAVADAGELMPPKSTWFEPKLPCGLFVRRINHRETILDGARRALRE